MDLTVEQRKPLYEAVQVAFQASADPGAMLRRRLLEDMGLRLAEISTDPSFENVVFSLIEHAESTDRAVELGAVALAEQPANDEARRFLQSVAGTEPDILPQP